jgi:hypothetical protein
MTEELREDLVDFAEPSDEICNQYWEMLKTLDPTQEGLRDIRQVHRTLKINHRVGNFVQIKLMGEGRLTRTPVVSGQGKRQRTTGLFYTWLDAPVVPVDPPPIAPDPVPIGGE